MIHRKFYSVFKGSPCVVLGFEICNYSFIESRRKKARNWEEEDYYDSDEDNFLDRTGTIERKREQRMKQAGKFEDKVETYSSLVMLDQILLFSYILCYLRIITHTPMYIC